MSTMERALSVRESRRTGLRAHFRAALAVLLKDIRCEVRAKHSFGAVLLFAVTSTIAVSFTLNAWGEQPAVAASLLWIVLYFSAMSGLSRAFVHEEETYTSALLKMVAPPGCVYLGKLAFNFIALIAIEVVTIPLFLVLMGCVVKKPGMFAVLLVLGTLALSAGATTAAAMVAKASNRGALFAGISFPLLVPALGLAIHGTEAAMSGAVSAGSDVRLLIYYSGVVMTASLMLFRFIWED